ncbi:MAG: tetratricopeptide repeat protein [Alphaproteobacteria bacterium]
MTPYLLVTILALVTTTVLFWQVRHKRVFCAAIAMIFLMASLALYHQFGNPDILPLLDDYKNNQEKARATVTSESETIKKDPKNLEAWIRLGQAFAELRQWKPAANAFKQTVLLSEGHPDLIMSYARAMIMDEDGKVSDASKKSLEMVLLQKPEHPEARYYMNVRLLQDGKTEDAMTAMKALYKSLPDDSPVKAMINAQIGRR